MLTPYGHLTYCTNIHGGEAWEDHFALLKQHFPKIKRNVSPTQCMGLGLRLSDQASKELLDETKFEEFRTWLAYENAYIYTMNGFPYGDFHQDVVKEDVHTPDWTTRERVDYTKRLFDILVRLLPDDMDGGVSTSPLGYRYHYIEDKEAWSTMRKSGTQHIVEVAAHLITLKRQYGKTLHLDIEPEPDGVLENGPEFIDWYVNELVPSGATFLVEQLGIERDDAIAALKCHVRICYDVCHFALGYEEHTEAIQQLAASDIRIGKFQISAAIKAKMPDEFTKRNEVGSAFMAFDEPVYLHQVIAKQRDETVVRHKDLPAAQDHIHDPETLEWRAHFHVPIFLEDMGVLQSTQSDIIDVLALQKIAPLTPHIEVETYTWGVLPESLQLPIAESISRELEWVIQQLT